MTTCSVKLLLFIVNETSFFTLHVVYSNDID